MSRPRSWPVTKSGPPRETLSISGGDENGGGLKKGKGVETVGDKKGVGAVVGREGTSDGAGWLGWPVWAGGGGVERA
eukprot:880574-Pleurochrysis_carterae.AAC.1